MKIKWTDAQSSAINAERANILVTAAAGSGKTQVLTERIADKVINGQDVSRLLIVTFTRAAAAEMRDRINGRITEAIKADPENTHLKKQISLLPGADIETIDSFCVELVKSRAVNIGVNVDFAIINDVDKDFMYDRAAETSMEIMYDKRQDDFVRFVKAFGGDKNDEKILKLIKGTYKFMMKMPYPMQWLDQAEDTYIKNANMPFEETDIAKLIIEISADRINQTSEKLLGAADMFDNLGLSGYAETLRRDNEAIKELVNNLSWDGIRNAFDNLKFLRMLSEKDATKEQNKRLQNIRHKIKEYIQKKIAPIFYYDAEQCSDLIRHNIAFVSCLCDSVREFYKAYTEMKEEKNVLDLNDIQHIAIKILEDETIAKEIMNQYDEIYIDEYQDIDAAQELIFDRISREREGTPNVFMVGDVKQSIYGFRNANPKLFTDKKKSYGVLPGDKNRKIALAKNFRSRPEVIDFVNMIFSKIMTESSGGVDYDHEEMLVVGAKYPDDNTGFCKAEIDIIDMENDGDIDDIPTDAECEAFYIAKRISEMMDKTVYDAKKGETRKIRYFDIVILLRAPKSNASVFEKVLKDNGIPCYSEVGEGFYQTTEIRTFLSLLSVIDNPLCDIPLLAVLRSPMFGFTEEHLASIRMCDNKSSFKKALDKAAELCNETGEMCRNFLKILREFRRRATYMPTDELIWYLYDKTGYRDFVAALPSGKMRVMNLDFLFYKAQEFEAASFKGLYNFLEFMNKESTYPDVREASEMSEGQDVVRIMSIHKSKGLEFPVVFLSGTGKEFNKESRKNAVTMHKNFGFGIRYIDEKLMISSKSPDQTAIQLKNEDEEMSEEIRTLYVALTRAKEKLIITGTVDSFANKSEKWEIDMKCITPRSILDTESYIDIISMCAKMGEEKCVGYNVISAASLPWHETATEAEKQNNDIIPVNNDTARKMDYTYPYKALAEIPSKISVTELLKKQRTNIKADQIKNLDETAFYIPRFAGNNKISAAMAGTYTHFILQLIDIKSINNEQDVINFVDKLVQDNIMTREAAMSVSCENIAKFCTSKLGERIKKADRVYRETPFTVSVPASYIAADKGTFSENVILQGIIDCFFFEGDKITLIDFKTDKNTDKNVIIEKYKMQMDLYENALEKKYFSKIHEKFIYLLYNNSIVKID